MFAIFLPLLLYLATHSQDKTGQNDPVLASHAISLTERYPNVFINEVFKENILLNLAYLRGLVHSRQDIDWAEVTEPFTYTLILKPDETFAFHDDVEEKYKNEQLLTTNAHFNEQEGFKSDGYLVGDGVCHLASLMYWAARDAGLTTEAPTNHDFAVIPQVPKEYGVSIYDAPGKDALNERQNLYVTNEKDKPVVFVFSYNDNQLKIDVKEIL